ncbi:MAG: hypothetical protein LBK50_03420 [Candidatus Nomurabacteria bacterium]|jgi:uncharacterized alpha/beta hydrolase family protein|nr:hypothetical protein [Candidatus Nomurabacteria bacterium]
MKKSDWALIILVAAVAGFVAFFATNSITQDSQRKPNEFVDTTITFSEDVVDPSEFVYSENGDKRPINPTIKVVTGTGGQSTGNPTDSDGTQENDATNNQTTPDTEQPEITAEE